MSVLCVSLPFVSPGSLISGAATVATVALKKIYLAGLTKEETGGKELRGSLNNEGVFTFSSIDDYNVLDTLMYILGAADWLKRWAHSATDQEYFDIRLPLLKKIEKPINDEYKAQEGLLRWVKGLTEADRIQNKMRILGTTRNDIVSIAENFQRTLKEIPAVTIIGNHRDVHTLQKEGIKLDVTDVDKIDS